MHDLPFQEDGNEFQIDTLIITGDAIYLYEIKNYEGTYYYKNGYFCSVFSDFKFDSPIEWLKRKETHLQKILYECGIYLPIKSFIVFVNPEFTLFDVSYSEKILLPTSIVGHLRSLSQLDRKLTQEHTYAASKLCDLSSKCNPNLKGVPDYRYEDLQKGLICAGCERFIQEVKERSKTVTCTNCGHRELASDCVYRHIEECRMMFPEMKLAIKSSCYWCDGVVSEKRIRYVLKKYYQAHGSGRGRYYDMKSD